VPKPTVLLEYSEDPLSIATPTYRDVTYPYLIDAAWWAGIENELDEPRAGGAVFRMKNLNRDWEPLLAGGPFTVDTDRRFPLFLNGTQEGEWFTSDFEIDYPGGTDYSLVTITCGDGQVLLGSDHLPALDPPDATSYEEVINHDEPAFYYRMGEPAGTKLVAHVRKVGRKGHRHKRRWKTLETSAELGGVSGPSGVYKGTPTLGEPGAIRGDPDKSVKFTSTGNERAMIQVDQSDLIDTNSSSSRDETILWIVAAAGFVSGGLLLLLGETISHNADKVKPEVYVKLEKPQHFPLLTNTTSTQQSLQYDDKTKSLKLFLDIDSSGKAFWK